MDDQVFILMNQKIDAVDLKVNGIGADVKKLLNRDNKIIGASIVISLLVGAAFQIILIQLK